MSSSLRPAWWVPGGHAQTIVPFLLPANDPGGVPVDVEVKPGTRVRVRLARPPRAARGTVLLLHGLDGSSESRYMRRTARQALDRGWIAARMNLRNCGGTEALSRTLYNAGQGADAEAVLAALTREGCARPYALVGFSLGGNMALGYAGSAGAACAADAVVGVNPPVDLAACIGSLERPGNLLYHLYFLHGLCAQIRRIRKVREVPGPAAIPGRIRSVRRFDDLFTAPAGGFRDAAEYYAAASAGPGLGGIRRPALVLAAADDPMVPLASFTAWRHAAESAGVRFVHPSTGGHVGYWGAGRPRFWAAVAVLDFVESVLGPNRA